MNENHAKQWAEIVGDITGYQHQLPRRIVHHQAKHTIVTFSDASTMAMAACAYISNAEEANFLMAKSKVADAKKPATIPKMELNAMTIAARLVHNILLSINPLLHIESVLLLCDSEIALNWLQYPKHQQGTGKYVSNRIKEIHKIVREIEGMSINVQIGYVDTKHNPADCATRGLSSSELMNHSWWKGYTLKEIQNNGYVSKLYTIQEEDGEPESAVTNHVRTTTNEDGTEKEIIKLSAHNDLRKVRRIVAYALRFLKGVHSRLHGTLKEKLQTSLPWIIHKVGSRNLSAKEIKDAETLLITQHQAAHLRPQYRKELVKNLDVREDKNHIVRANGRLNKANLDADAKNPIVIAPKTEMSRLIIAESHDTYHKSVAHTMSDIRQKFWIPRLREQVKKYIRKCIPCQKLNALPYKYPQMPDLPSIRVTRARPFQHIGLDYFGPIPIREEGQD
ncbi:hypothetical protein V3C99_004829, partial [Haemonchus contortus]